MVRPIKPIKMLVFTEGTIIMHIEKEQESVHDYASYVPIGNAIKKLNSWKNQGARILYLTSRKMPDEVLAD